MNNIWFSFIWEKSKKNIIKYSEMKSLFSEKIWKFKYIEQFIVG
jgi:hypothetical protein